MIKTSERVIRSLILDFFDECYRDVDKNPHASHCAIRTIYSYLAGAVPNARMESCYKAVYDVCQDCLSSESIYPFPDGGPWTDEERNRYQAYLMNARSLESEEV